MATTPLWRFGPSGLDPSSGSRWRRRRDTMLGLRRYYACWPRPAAIEAIGRHELLAETYRLRGALLLRQAVPDATEAEASFRQALTVARRQQAKSWELRPATSLNRLWPQQGKRDEAGALLASIYAWFAEGFDSAHLQEAKTLLEELGGGLMPRNMLRH